MPEESIKQILMRRDGMTSEEADSLIQDAQIDFNSRMDEGDDLEDFCQEWFGLEPDYIDEFLFSY